MAVSLGDAVLTVHADTSQVKSDVQKGVDSAGSGSQSKLLGAGKKIAGGIGKGLSTGIKIVGAGAAATLGYSLTKGFSRMTAIENAQAKLTGLGNSAKDVQKIMENANAAVLGTAYGLDEAATVSASAVAAGIKPGRELEKTLKLVADAATIGGVSMTDMGAIFNKVATSNKVQGDVINQLNDQGIPIVQLLGKSMHKTAEEVYEMSRAGDIGFADFQKAMQAGVGGAALESGKTFTGAFANMQAAFGRFGAALMGGVFPHLTTSIGNLTTFVNSLTKAVGPLADEIGTKLGKALDGWTGKLAAIKPETMINGVNKITAAVKGLWALLAHGDYTGNLKTAFGWFEDSPIVDSILDIRDALIQIKNPMGQVGDAMKTGAAAGQKMSGGMTAVSDGTTAFVAVGRGLVGVLEALTPVFQTLGEILPKVGGTIATILVKALNFLADHLDTILKLLPLFIAGLITYRVAMQGAATAQAALTAAQLKMLPVSIVNNALRVTAAFLERQNSRALAGETGATVTNTAARVLNTAGLVAQRAATIAATVVTNGLAFATKALGIAMKVAMGPVGWIIAGIGLLVAGLIFAYKHSETFRKIVDAAFAGIKKAAEAALGWFTGTLVPFFTQTLPNAFRTAVDWVKANWPKLLIILTGPIGLAVTLILKYKDQILGFFQNLLTGAQTKLSPIGSFFRKIGSAFAAVGRVFKIIYDGWIEPVFELLGAIVVWLSKKIFAGAMTALKAAWRGLGTVFRAVYNGVIKPIINAFAAVVRWLNKNVFRPVIDGMKQSFRNFATGLRVIYNTIIKPMLRTFADLLKWLRDKIAKPIFSAIKTAFRALGNGLSTIYNTVIKPVIKVFRTALNGLLTLFRTVRDGVKGAWSAMATGVKNTWDKTISVVFSAFKKAANTMKSGFTTVATGIGTQWEKIRDAAKKPIHFVIDTVINKGLIGTFNKLADFFHTKHMRDVPVPFARGGVLGGSSIAGQGDDQLIRARRGEGVAVSELMRNPVERERMLLMNKAALKGRAALARAQRSWEGGYATGGLVGGSGRFSSLATQFLLKAQQIAGTPFSIFQRGFRPATSYSGTSHQGDAIDTGPVNNKVVSALRSVAWAAWDRTGKGNWVPHIHAVPLPGAGYPAGSAVWQGQDYLKGGDGLGGRDNGPRSGLAKITGWISSGAKALKTKVGSIVGGVGDFVASINPGEMVKKALSKAMAGAEWLAKSPFGQVVAAVPKKIASMATEWGKKKLAAMGDLAGNIKDSAVSGGAQAYVHAAALKRWGPGQWGALKQLIENESSWNPKAVNSSSGAYGLFQLLGSNLSALGGDRSIAKQTQVGLNYIAQAYGNPVEALRKWNSRSPHWYDDGGWLKPGWNYNGLGKKEPTAVFTPNQWAVLSKLADTRRGEGSGLQPGDRIVLDFEGETFTTKVRKVLSSETKKARVSV